MKKREWFIALSLGLLWGAAEATVGTLLHLIPIPLGPYLWFPMAYGFLRWVYASARSTQALLVAGAVAALTKLTGLPAAPRLDIVINPALSILLESLSMALVAGLAKRRPIASWPSVAIVNGLWRLGYLVCMLALPIWIKALSPLSGWQAALTFLLLEGFITTAVAAGLGWAMDKGLKRFSTAQGLLTAHKK